MAAILSIPEVSGLDASASVVRIPPEVNVPLTERVRALVDTAPFRRLASIRQLGLVGLVYPGATHNRFEHSLGVYRTALLFLRQLGRDPRFTEAVSVRAAELFIVTALLHDVGHWPFCHPIEDLGLGPVPRHEAFVERYLESREVSGVLREMWRIEPAEVVELLSGEALDRGSRLLSSMLSGPVDVDKLDYLQRDSLHAGVPYGRHFDAARLISSLCINEAGDGLAITEKGKTAAELMVFARYVMFSEVYWHHGVRSATAMLQRGFYEVSGALDLASAFELADEGFVDALLQAADGMACREVLGGLFGPTRRLYKRVAEFSCFERRDLYDAVARRPYPDLVACAHELAPLIRERGVDVEPHELLVDAPPVEKEVEFRIDVHFVKQGTYRPLQDVSPVVRALAREQFDDYVKRVRVFAHPRIAGKLTDLAELPELVATAATRSRCGATRPTECASGHDAP